MIYAVFFMIMSGVICFIFLNREQQSVMPISVTEISRMKCFAERIASGDLDTPSKWTGVIFLEHSRRALI